MLIGCNHQALLRTIYRCFWKCGVPQNCYSIGKWLQPNAFWNFEVTLFSAKPFFRIWSLPIQDEPKSPFGQHENSKPWWNQLPNCLLLEAPFLIIFCDGEPWEQLHDCLKQTPVHTQRVGRGRRTERCVASVPSRIAAHMDLAIDGSPRSSRSVENRFRAHAWALRSLQYQDGKVLLWAWSS